MTAALDTAARRADLATNLAQVHERIRAACRGAGRAREDVQLIVVTKYFPGADIEMLCHLGVTDIGESRAQEAVTKLEDPALRPTDTAPVALTRHFIGQVQTNKATLSIRSTGSSWSSPLTGLPPLLAVISARSSR